jgi:hypothetical protein
MARPSKYDPAYCEQVIELGKQGMSIVEIACALGVHRETIEKNWPEKHPEFSEAFARARDESQAWWEKAGREGLTADKFNAQVWSRSMAARFPHDWREKTLVGSDPDNPLPDSFAVKLVKPRAEGD